jgi:hypothetical protein
MCFITNLSFVCLDIPHEQSLFLDGSHSLDPLHHLWGRNDALFD